MIKRSSSLKLRNFEAVKSALNPIPGYGIFQFAYQVDDGSYYQGSHTACHSVLSDLSIGDRYTAGSVMVHDSVRLFTTTWDRSTDKCGERLLSFILDKEKSPWRKILTDAVIHDGFVEIQAHHPAQVVANFCVMTRMLGERPERTKHFNTALDNGCTPYEALFIYASSVMLNGTVSLAHNSGGHFPFNDTQGISLTRLRDGDPKHHDTSIRNARIYTDGGVNIIWAENQPPLLNLLAGEMGLYSGSFHTYRSYQYGGGKSLAGVSLDKFFREFHDKKGLIK